MLTNKQTIEQTAMKTEPRPIVVVEVIMTADGRASCCSK